MYMLNKQAIAIVILFVGMVISFWLHFDGRGQTAVTPSSEEIWKALEPNFAQNVIAVINQAIQEQQAQQQQQPQAEEPQQ